MSDSVIVIVANDAYLDQVKSLMVNCRRQGKWQGDFCLMCAEDSGPANDLQDRDIVIYHVPDAKWSMFTKFHIFGASLGGWDRVLCLDCDILIQNDLNECCDGMAKQFPFILFDGSSDGSIVHNWRHFDALYGDGPDAHPELYEKMRAQFPHIDKRILTADVIFFDPASVPEGTVEALQATGEKFLEANRGRIDQPVYNLVLYNKMAPIGKDFCTWWAFDDPGSRVPNEDKGWRGDEFPAIIHYWNSFAPWLEKTPDAGAYDNERLGRVCRELWAENLGAFNETFPVMET